MVTSPLNCSTVIFAAEPSILMLPLWETNSLTVLAPILFQVASSSLAFKLPVVLYPDQLAPFSKVRFISLEPALKAFTKLALVMLPSNLESVPLNLIVTLESSSTLISPSKTTFSASLDALIFTLPPLTETTLPAIIAALASTSTCLVSA